MPADGSRRSVTRRILTALSVTLAFVAIGFLIVRARVQAQGAARFTHCRNNLKQTHSGHGRKADRMRSKTAFIPDQSKSVTPSGGASRQARSFSKNRRWISTFRFTSPWYCDKLSS